MKDLLVEIGTEELPARFIENAKEGFKTLLQEALLAKKIGFREIFVYGTPRRICAFVADVNEKQEEILTLKYGPPVKIAYDEYGNPQKPAIGFAKSQGVSVDELKKVEKDGVYVVACEKREGGKHTEEVLPQILEDVIPRIPFPKKMRWGYEKFEFARPIQWMVVLFGQTQIKITIADVQSGNITYGHRFLSAGPIVLSRPEEYFSKLRDAYVIVDEKERKKIILDGIEKIENQVGAKALYDEDLLAEILYITEYPYAMKGAFDAQYLSLPSPVLINVMKSHQRYIPLVADVGKLKPFFIFFSNTFPLDEKIIIKGNEKVLKARLDDAKFYFEEDKKIDLFALYEKLSSLVYHEKLGNMKEKSERVKNIALFVAKALNFQDFYKIERTSILLKIDLLTHMVGEFPELQGKMGRIYAELRGEDQETCLAIEEHYYPSAADGQLPTTRLGIVMSIADKIDTLVSFFSIGIVPTGNLDPYGLRRCAIGLLRTLLQKGLHVCLKDLISVAYENGTKISNRLSFDMTMSQLTDFIATRFKFLMIEEGFEQDLVESVLEFVSHDPYDAYLRLSSLKELKSLPDFERLVVGFKRVFNITKNVENTYEVRRELFEKEEEHRLLSTYEEKRESYFSLVRNRRYRDALSILIEFKDPIDKFFENVFVMVEDESVRTNRLILLKNIKDMFVLFCDFQKIKSD